MEIAVPLVCLIVAGFIAFLPALLGSAIGGGSGLWRRRRQGGGDDDGLA